MITDNELNGLKTLFFTAIAEAMSKSKVTHMTIIYQIDDSINNTSIHKAGEESTTTAEFFDTLSDHIDTFLSLK